MNLGADRFPRTEVNQKVKHVSTTKQRRKLFVSGISGSLVHSQECSLQKLKLRYSGPALYHSSPIAL